MWKCQRYLKISEGLACRSFAVQATKWKVFEEKHSRLVIEDVKPFHELPRPSKMQLLRGFLPGGRYYKKSLVEVNREFRRQFGDIFLIPGLFGKRDLVFTFEPSDYEKVFRTEGLQPIRRGLDIVQYHRKTHRPEVFKHAAGLVAEQGEGWAHFRSTVNPVMMNSKTIKLYAPKMNKVVDEFMQRIRAIRDPATNEVPPNFEEEINHWAMESVGLVALDTELGMIGGGLRNARAKAVIDGMREFFELLFELDMKPSLWKYVATPKFNKTMRKFDQMTDLSIHYIDKAIRKLDAGRENHKAESEKSILESLLHLDRTVAVVMAMDIILAGVDTTTSALVGCLLALAKNPEEQQKLRHEICKILPNKDSPLGSEQMRHMPYLRACIKEAFRYYPVSTGNFRSTGRDVVLSGYRIPKNTDIVMPGQLLMRDEKYYGRPDEYRPERWFRREEATPTNECPLNRNVPFVFLPFGFGPRICIGKRIVDLELEVALAKLVRNFDIHFEYAADDMFKTHIINVPSKPLQFRFTDLPN